MASFRPHFPQYFSAFTLLLKENFAKYFTSTLASLLYYSFKFCLVFLLIAFFFFCIQKVLWWEDWNLFCLARILHWDVIPCSSCWLNLFSLWLVYNGWKYEQVSIISWAKAKQCENFILAKKILFLLLNRLPALKACQSRQICSSAVFIDWKGGGPLMQNL